MPLKQRTGTHGRRRVIEVRRSSGSDQDGAETLVTPGRRLSKNPTPALEDASIIGNPISPASRKPLKTGKAR